jgi:hypothetical protein
MVARTMLPAVGPIPDKYWPWLGHKVAFGDFEVWGPPEFAVRNSLIRIRIAKKPTGNFEFRLGLLIQPRFPRPGDTHDWSYDEPWRSDETFDFRPQYAGTIGFHLQVRVNEGGEPLFDIWVGQTVVYERTEIAALTYLPAAHLAIERAPATGSEETVAARDWRNVPDVQTLAAFFRAQPRDEFDRWARSTDVGELAELFALVSFVSNLWAYGEEDEAAEVSMLGREPVSLARALSSSAANCAEFSAMFALLAEELDLATCRSAGIHGHMLVEADVAGSRWLLCPTTGLAINGSLERISSVGLDEEVRVILFRTLGMERNSPHWRPRLAAFRNYLITGLAARCFTPYELRRDWRAALPLAAALSGR